jgi:hypothetical protein
MCAIKRVLKKLITYRPIKLKELVIRQPSSSPNKTGRPHGKTKGDLQLLCLA